MMTATPGKRIRSLAALLGGLLLLFCTQCRPLPPPSGDVRPVAEPDLAFNQLFARRNGGWTGGDGTLSILLPDGRTAWLFGDTLLGTVAADNTRPPDTPFIRNSLVVQDGNALETRLGYEGEKRVAFFSPSSAGEWFWPGHGIVTGGQLKIFLHRFEKTEPRLWAWRWAGNVLASVSLPSLTLTRIDPAPSENGLLYGVCLVTWGGNIYIYGTEDHRHPKVAHLARAPAGGLDTAWSYFSGTSWSDRPAATRAILTGVSTQYSVIHDDHHFYLFTMDGRMAFSSLIVVYRAVQPQGPWQGPLAVYRAPETSARIFAYNPFAHPQFSAGRQVLISYNLNHVSDPDALYRDAAIYRPRFIRVDLSEVDRRLDEHETGTLTPNQ